jgi:hypothetical protein
MIREVITIHRITPNREELNLSCGHSVPTNPSEVKKLATEAATNRTSLKVNCEDCDKGLRRFALYDYVSIIGGPHAGEKGRVLELFSGKQYGVKLLTGPDEDQQGTFVAEEQHLEPISSPRNKNFRGWENSPPDPLSPNHVWDQATESWQELGPGPGKFIDAEEVEDLIERLHTRASIRRQIPNRKSVQEAKPDRIAALFDEAGTTMKELLEEACKANQLQRLFDLRWEADMRAVKRWQAANPGNDLIWPDRADLVVWLLDREDALLKRLAALDTPAVRDLIDRLHIRANIRRAISNRKSENRLADLLDEAGTALTTIMEELTKKDIDS